MLLQPKVFLNQLMLPQPPDTTKELEAPQQEKEDVKEEKEVKESPKEEPKEGDLI